MKLRAGLLCALFGIFVAAPLPVPAQLKGHVKGDEDSSTGHKQYADLHDRAAHAHGTESDHRFAEPAADPRLPASQAGRDYALYRDMIANGDRTPKALTGLARAATDLGDHELAHRTAAEVLREHPGNKAAGSIFRLTEGMPSTRRLADPLEASASPRPAAAEEPPARAAAGEASVPPSAPATGLAPGAAPEASFSGAAQAAAAGGEAGAAAAARHIESARRALALRDQAAALANLGQALEASPDHPEALNLRAVAYNIAGRYQEAAADATRSLALRPGNPGALQARSYSFSRRGLFREALADAEAAITLQPGLANSHLVKAHALAGLGGREGALESLRRAAALDARHQPRLERALQLPRAEDLVLLFEEAAAVRPAPAPARANRARRFTGMALLSVAGGVLVAMGLLQLASAERREKLGRTVRRALSTATRRRDAGGGAFWAQYRLVREIGAGGMGVVYEAQDRSLERRVAVKKMREEIRADPRERERFINEARLVARLRHPRIVDIYAIIEDETDVFLVFEFVPGRTLQAVLKEEGPLSPAACARVLREACEAVSYAHSRGVIHRDLKTSNIMVAPDGSVKVMDFGVARLAKDAFLRASQTNTVAGTPAYMPPEQEQGVVRPESDVYALGVCLYETLTGRLPFAGEGAGLLVGKLKGEHIPPSRRLPGLPPAVDAVLARALHPDPEKRWRTPEELSAAFEAALRPGAPRAPSEQNSARAA